MSADAWVIGGMLLAGMAGSFWWARRYDLTYKMQIDAANQLHRRSLSILDRQEELLRRAESLEERLEKQRDSA